jgi:hypothetical protein
MRYRRVIRVSTLLWVFAFLGVANVVDLFWLHWNPNLTPDVIEQQMIFGAALIIIAMIARRRYS